MATEKTDVVIVGVGAAGGILAAELGKAGMKVIGLERGPRLKTADFEPHDELRYFPAPGSAARTSSAMPVTWRPNANARANPIADPEQRQSGRRRHRALRRAVVALPRGRFPRPLADHRALRRVGDPGGLLAHRLAAELRRSRAVLRPRRIRARRVRQGRQSAGQEDRRRQRVRSAAQPRLSAAAAARRSVGAIFRSRRQKARLSTRSRRRAPSSRSPTRTGRAAPIAASARRSAATSAPSRSSWSPSCRRPTPPAISSWSPAPCATASTATTAGKRDRRVVLRPGRLRQHDRGRDRHPGAVHLRQYAAAAAVEDREIPQRARQFERPGRQAHHGPYRGARVRHLRRPLRQHLHGPERAEAHASTISTPTISTTAASASSAARRFRSAPPNLEGGPIGTAIEHDAAARHAALGRRLSRLLRQVLHAPRRHGRRRPRTCPMRTRPSISIPTCATPGACRRRASPTTGGGRTRKRASSSCRTSWTRSAAPWARRKSGGRRSARGAPGAHHEGGTRMGSDPKTSVVNQYSQSWDIPNLFVIGSSTFPTMSRLQSDADHPGAGLYDRRRHREKIPE